MTSINNTEVAALSDLTARMARSLQLPATATTAAVVVAVRCARDAATSQASLFGSSSTASRNGVGSTGTSSTVRRRANKRSYSALRRGGKNGMFAERNGGKNGHPPWGAKLQDTPETIAISSLLLVCMAGGTMQRLARQAVDKRNQFTRSRMEREKFPMHWRIWSMTYFPPTMHFLPKSLPPL